MNTNTNIVRAGGDMTVAYDNARILISNKIENGVIENWPRELVWNGYEGGALVVNINKDDHNNISVDDDGCGMDADTLQRVQTMNSSSSGDDLKSDSNFGSGGKVSLLSHFHAVEYNTIKGGRALKTIIFNNEAARKANLKGVKGNSALDHINRHNDVKSDEKFKFTPIEDVSGKYSGAELLKSGTTVTLHLFDSNKGTWFDTSWQPSYMGALKNGTAILKILGSRFATFPPRESGDDFKVKVYQTGARAELTNKGDSKEEFKPALDDEIREESSWGDLPYITKKKKIFKFTNKSDKYPGVVLYAVIRGSKDIVGVDNFSNKIKAVTGTTLGFVHKGEIYGKGLDARGLQPSQSTEFLKSIGISGKLAKDLSLFVDVSGVPGLAITDENRASISVIDFAASELSFEKKKLTVDDNIFLKIVRDLMPQELDDLNAKFLKDDIEYTAQIEDLVFADVMSGKTQKKYGQSKNGDFKLVCVKAVKDGDTGSGGEADSFKLDVVKKSKSILKKLARKRTVDEADNNKRGNKNPSESNDKGGISESGDCEESGADVVKRRVRLDKLKRERGDIIHTNIKILDDAEYEEADEWHGIKVGELDGSSMKHSFVFAGQTTFNGFIKKSSMTKEIVNITEMVVRQCENINESEAILILELLINTEIKLDLNTHKQVQKDIESWVRGNGEDGYFRNLYWFQHLIKKSSLALGVAMERDRQSGETKHNTKGFRDSLTGELPVADILKKSEIEAAA